MNIIRLASYSCLITGLVSCAQQSTHYHSPNSQMGQMIANLERTEADFLLRTARHRYRETAKAFVAKAQINDVKAMIQMTSPITLKRSGVGHVTRVYTEQVIPRFAGKRVIWEDPMEETSDELGNRGLLVAGRTSGTEAVRFTICVMEEQGRFKVITLNAKKI